MSEHTWWYVARATGYVAWTLLAASVITGLLLRTRLTRGRPTLSWTLDLHRFLGGASVVFTGLHLVGLVADGFVPFTAADILVPFASRWKTGAVALGVVALHLLLTVEVTSLLMRHIPRRAWRAVHLTSYLAFWLTTFHLIAAGTDARNGWSQLGTDLAIAFVVFLTLVRVLSGRGPGRRAGGGASAVGS